MQGAIPNRRPPASVLLYAVIAACSLLLICALHYLKYSRLIDRKLELGPLADTLDIFASQTFGAGDPVSASEAAAALRANGYTETQGGAIGYYQRTKDGLEIFPGPESHTAGDPVRIRFSAGKISGIFVSRNDAAVDYYEIGPQLITNVSDRAREKRRPVRFAEIPKSLVQAVVSVEDKRFFEHGGLDSLRVIKAGWIDLKEGRKKQGASTLTMQLARSLWLDSNKSWRRKAAEVLIAFHLERKLSKEQIFEHYANEIYLGQRGTFGIHGFGQAARAYFGKEIQQLSTAEAAALAGMAQRPSYYNPARHPQRVIERRNQVLDLMLENGYLNRADHAAAVRAPLTVAPQEVEAREAPYFVDLVQADIQERLGDPEENLHRAHEVYTTLDPNLQRAAEEAVQAGAAALDRRFEKRSRDGARPQIALIALDPHTGAVKALVGGRDYAASQLNRVLAKRQPGSAFKPFVYAAALNTAVTGGRAIFTPATTIVDEPTTFWFAKESYQPGNFGNEFYGQVTVRQALARSLNVPTIKIAEATGYGAVAELARLAGLRDVQPTPSAAIGSYDATPLEVAGAFTVFANQGTYVSPYLISQIRAPDGAVSYQHSPETRRVLDPRVAYLMVNLLEGVVQSGTAAGARARGFVVPAAGKTGTSRDGWFVGFTTELLSLVWVGFDDHRDLKLEGSKSALPIWTDFMKRAVQYRAYGNARRFQVPPGIVGAEIDPDTGQLASDYCPEARWEVFIAGTQPAQSCALHRQAPTPANVTLSAR